MSQASLRLLQNRRWYHELQQLVATEGQGNGQREMFLLGCVRRLIEEGVALDGRSVQLLMSLCAPPSLKSTPLLCFKCTRCCRYTQPSLQGEFTSPTVQCILAFLCSKFKVAPQQH